jgi:hypothetical protein
VFIRGTSAKQLPFLEVAGRNTMANIFRKGSARFKFASNNNNSSNNNNNNSNKNNVTYTPVTRKHLHGNNHGGKE